MENLSDDTIGGGAILDSPIVCTLTDAERVKRRVGIANLVAEAGEVVELKDGYSFSFPGSAGLVTRLVNMIVAERDCCLFFTFALTFSPNQGPVWLTVLGPAGVKELIQNFLSPEQLASLAPAAPAGTPAEPWVSPV